MTVLKQYNTSTSQWETIVVGAKGDPGIVQSTTAPANTNLLWLDTDDNADVMPVPSGGSKGQVLAKASDTDYDSAWVDAAVSENYIINGAFDVWQRGITFSNPSNSANGFCADRWQYVRDANQAGISVSRQDAGLSGFQYCARLQRIAGDTGTNNFRFGTSLETVNSLHMRGKTVTISFYARAGANMVGQLGINVYSGTGTDQPTVWNEFTNNFELIASSVTPGASWNRYSFTGNVPTTSNQIGIRFWRVNLTGVAGASDYVDITGVQLEIGSAATPFRRSGGDIAGELAKCQRYYQRFAPGAYREYMQGYAQTTNSVSFIPRLYCKMRVFPTSVEYNDIYFYDGSSYPSMTSLTLFGGEFGTISANFSSVTQFRNYTMYAGTSGNSYLALSAEIV